MKAAHTLVLGSLSVSDRYLWLPFAVQWDQEDPRLTFQQAQGAALVASKIAEVQATITTVQAAFVFLGAERAKLEAID